MLFVRAADVKPVTVCDDYFNTNGNFAGTFVCTSMGFDAFVSFSNSKDSDRTGYDIGLDNLECSAGATSMEADCTYTTVPRYCQHWEDVLITCSHLIPPTSNSGHTGGVWFRHICFSTTNNY